MRSIVDDETRAVAKLIAQIDALDAWRNRPGRRVLLLFAAVFLAALCLLGWVALFDGPPRKLQTPPGPRVPAVLHNFNRR